MPTQNPIGVFDSGFGGLTVLKEIIKKLPDYDYIYLGDNARAPYGNRSFETVYRYTLECVKWFFSKGCHLVILACNTASAKALRTIQQHDLPKIDKEKRVLGVIRPTTEVIGSLSESKHVGILGTTGTINSNSYVLEIEKFYPRLKVYQQACPMGKVPVVCKDSPGFIVNRVARPYYIESLRLLEEGHVSSETIDTLLEGSGFKLGPFKLMDLIGNDINYSVSCSVYEQLNKPERLMPSAIQKEKVERGELGKKTGKGYYTYNQ